MNKLIVSSWALAALLLPGANWAAQQQVAPSPPAQPARQAPAGPAVGQGQPAAQAQPTPAQQEAAAKKAAADAKAARDKELLSAAMDRSAERWRKQAPDKGWRIQPPPAVTGVPPAVAAANVRPGAVRDAAEAGLVPPGVTPPGAGMPADAPQNAAGAAATAPATGAAPRSPQALSAANVPIKSEKLGTAPPSGDTKSRPTPSLPRGTAPAVQKAHSPDTANKQ